MPAQQASFSDVVNSEEFRAILQHAMDTLLRAEDLQKMPMPPGCTPEEMLRFLALVESCAGIHSDVKPWFRNVKTPKAWFFLDKETRGELSACATLAARDAHINRALRNDDYRDALASFVVTEVTELAQKDGLSLSQQQIHALLLNRKDAKTPEEQIIHNFTNIYFSQIQRTGNQTFSRILMHDLYHELTEGVGDLALKQTTFFSKKHCFEWLLSDAEYASETIDQIINVCRNARNIDEVIIASITMSYCLWDVRFFPQLCGLTEYLLREAFFAIHDCPILSFVPHYHLISTTFHDYLDSYETEYLNNTDEGINGSWIYSGCIKAFKYGLDQIYKAIESLEQNRGQIEQKIDALGSINMRQKTFLLDAVNNQSRRYTIREYAQHYEVVYATARKDLSALTNMGYLQAQKIGGIVYYQIHPAYADH